MWDLADNPTDHWYEFLYDGATGAEILPDRIVLHFVDGQRGDDDLSANGRIVEPGGPAILVDTTPPTIHSVSANPNILWPVNHKMVEVTVEVDASDNSGMEPVSGIAWVESNEPINGSGDGNTEPDYDWDFTEDPLVVLLRAERAGGGDGRVYTIWVQCTDAAGNTTLAPVDVTVPHDQGQNKKK